MPSSHLSLHYHVVFSTKDRKPWMVSEWRGRLHSYMGGVLKKSGCVPEAIGGVADHVHLLIGASASAQLSSVVRELKTLSSKWVHEEAGEKAFAWQEGYGAFTVSASHRETVITYILNQEEHHATRSFQDEYLEFLEKSGVAYKEEHLW